MYRTLLLGIGLITPGLAMACGGSKSTASADAQAAQTTASVDASHCAKKTELVGANCSYTTGLMAQRVLEEGENWSYTGTLVSSSNALDSRVAAPFTVGPKEGINVVANEVVEGLVKAGADTGRLALSGKLLEVDGIRYFVATAFKASNS
jgi:hypothetical protein